MDIQERIHKIGEYFQLFNIAENVAYIVAKFPKNWTIAKSIEQEYNIQTKCDQEKGITYFFAELSQNPNGLESSFDAVDAVIKLNKEIEIRAKIFKEKAEQLKEIIYTESIESLNNLEFVIKHKKRREKKRIQTVKQIEMSNEELQKENEINKEDSSESDLFKDVKKMIGE